MRYVYINLLAGAKSTALQVGWSQEAEEAAPGEEYKIDHNSLNF